MRVASLFSGIGGIDLGLERAGHTVVFQCESDEWRRRVLAERFPGVPCYDDVRTVGAADVRLADGRGQGQELAGRVALVDSRHAGPSAFADEEQDARGVHPVDLVCGGFPCQDLSVAGKRAGLAGDRSGLFFEFARIADALLPAGGWVLVENVPGLLSSNGGRDFAVVLATLAELGFHDLAWRILDSRHFGVPQRRRRVFVLARRARGRRACEVLLEPESGGGHFAARGQTGAGAAGASAVSALQGGGDQYGSAVRRLTPVECERLQSFPDDWTAIDGAATPDSRRYAALGDAVTVNVAEWIGRRLGAAA